LRTTPALTPELTPPALLLPCLPCLQPGGAGGAAAAAGAAAASESVGLRKELLADVAELRRLFDLYMGQLANLTGPDAEAAMKAALEAVDQLDGALSLEKVGAAVWYLCC
jgi:hypothetical protein